MSWHNAEAYCKSLGAHLATITSQAENDFVYPNLVASAPNEMVWLGATDEAQEDTWEWNTSEAWDYVNWAGGEPNDCGGIEDYLVYFTPHDPEGRAGFWNDLGTDDSGGCGCGGCVHEWYPMSALCERQVAHHASVGGADVCEALGLPTGCDANFSLVANQKADGSVKGQWQDTFPGGGEGIHVAVDCLNVVGNGAVIGGVITHGTSGGVDPAGQRALTAVVDHGTSAIDPPDQLSFSFFPVPDLSCTDLVPTQFPLFDLARGQVKVW